MNPNVRIVVRMWDDKFAAQLRQFMNVEVVLSASDLAAPAFAGAAVGIEVAQSLRIDDKDYTMIKFIVEPGSFLDGAILGEIESDNDIDIMLHQRHEQAKVHPAGEIVVQAGDTLVMFALHSKIIEIVARNKRGINGS